MEKDSKIISEIIEIFDNVIELKVKAKISYFKNILIIMLGFRNKDIFEIYLGFKNI